jgi:hypothetical protein
MGHLLLLRSSPTPRAAMASARVPHTLMRDVVYYSRAGGPRRGALTEREKNLPRAIRGEGRATSVVQMEDQAKKTFSLLFSRRRRAHPSSGPTPHPIQKWCGHASPRRPSTSRTSRPSAADKGAQEDRAICVRALTLVFSLPLPSPALPRRRSSSPRPSAPRMGAVRRAARGRAEPRRRAQCPREWGHAKNVVVPHQHHLTLFPSLPPLPPARSPPRAPVCGDGAHPHRGPARGLPEADRRRGRVPLLVVVLLLVGPGQAAHFYRDGRVPLRLPAARVALPPPHHQQEQQHHRGPGHPAPALARGA